MKQALCIIGLASLLETSSCCTEAGTCALVTLSRKKLKKGWKKVKKGVDNHGTYMIYYNTSLGTAATKKLDFTGDSSVEPQASWEKPKEKIKKSFSKKFLTKATAYDKL